MSRIGVEPLVKNTHNHISTYTHKHTRKEVASSRAGQMQRASSHPIITGVDLHRSVAAEDCIGPFSHSQSVIESKIAQVFAQCID